jgi:hypothetical protein
MAAANPPATQEAGLFAPKHSMYNRQTLSADCPFRLGKASSTQPCCVTRLSFHVRCLLCCLQVLTSLVGRLPTVGSAVSVTAATQIRTKAAVPLVAVLLKKQC